MVYIVRKIERIPFLEDFKYKFFVTRTKEDYLLDIHQYISLSNRPSYEEIVRVFGLDDLIGIGCIDHAANGENTLGLWSGPRDNPQYRSVSKEIMAGFEKVLLERFNREVSCKLEIVLNLCVPEINFRMC